MRKQSYEAQLAELILSAFDSGVLHGVEWNGRARELKDRLTDEKAKGRRDAERFLSWQGATGTHLARLASKSAEYEREVGLRVKSLGQREGVERYGILRVGTEEPDKPEGKSRSEEGCF